jgi:hypothetical protein
MPSPRFRFVSVPSAISGAPAGWAGELLREGEVALLGEEGLEAIDALAHELQLASIVLVRSGRAPGEQERTVVDYAGSLPLIWVAPSFPDDVSGWAHKRGPMTLLVESDGPLSEEERRRIDRFVAILGRQSE